MGVCIIGAGPSGLYACKYLIDNNIPVTIYEKDNDILGHFKYSSYPNSGLNEIIKDKRVNLKLQSDHNSINDKKCDLYIVATGGMPRDLDIDGKEYCLDGMDIIKDHFNNKLKYLGDRICIIGMGNVTMDIIKYVHNKCKEIVVLSRSNLDKSSFDIHEMREISNIPTIDVRTNLREGDISSSQINGNNLEINVGNRRIERLKELFRNLKLQTKKAVTNLNLLFETKVKKFEKVNDKIKVTFEERDMIKKEIFDKVIKSIGFIPNRVVLNTKKPVYYLGWCDNSIGNVNDSRVNAKNLVDEIIKEHY